MEDRGLSDPTRGRSQVGDGPIPTLQLSAAPSGRYGAIVTGDAVRGRPRRSDRLRAFVTLGGTYGRKARRSRPDKG